MPTTLLDVYYKQENNIKYRYQANKKVQKKLAPSLFASLSSFN